MGVFANWQHNIAFEGGDIGKSNKRKDDVYICKMKIKGKSIVFPIDDAKKRAGNSKLEKSMVFNEF